MLEQYTKHLDVWYDLRLLDVTLEKGADGHLRDMLDTILLTADLEQADIVLAVACIAELRVRHW